MVPEVQVLEVRQVQVLEGVLTCRMTIQEVEPPKELLAFLGAHRPDED